MRALLILAAAVALGSITIGAAQATAQDESGTIRGIVFEDLDGDGARDPGEAGLLGVEVRLRRGNFTLQRVHSAADGAFAFEHVDSGQYQVAAHDIDAALGAHICSAGVFSFNPFPGAYCVGTSVPLHLTTSASVDVTLEVGQELEVAFGARRAEVDIFAGVALLETDFAPAGTLIEAFVHDQECGSTTVPPVPPAGYIGDHQFQLNVLGQSERSGCAVPGDEITFRVGGVPAAEAELFEPTTAASRPFTLIALTAMRQHAWYWYEQSGEDLPADRTSVQAVIDGAVCGEARIEALPGTGIAGFSRLLVPSEELQPGCGRPGAMVTFMVEGVATGRPIEWEPGLQYVNPFSPPLSEPSVLPETGGGSASDGSVVWLVVASSAAAGFALAGAGLLAGRRVGPR